MAKNHLHTNAWLKNIKGNKAQKEIEVEQKLNCFQKHVDISDFHQLDAFFPAVECEYVAPLDLLKNKYKKMQKKQQRSRWKEFQIGSKSYFFSLPTPVLRFTWSGNANTHMVQLITMAGFDLGSHAV